MTEAEWLAGDNPTPMLDALRGKVSDRKLRLFGVSCCRRVWHLLTDKYSRKALAVAERYADGEVTAEKLGFAWGDVRRSAQAAYREARPTAEGHAMMAVSRLCEADVARALMAVGYAASCKGYQDDAARMAEALREQSSLLRDVFGIPFRPVYFSSAWRTPDVTALATAAYEERTLPSGELAPDRLAVLADALEEIGAAGEVVAHLRGPGPHVRGCWAVDLVLGKE